MCVVTPAERGGFRCWCRGACAVAGVFSAHAFGSVDRVDLDP